MDIDGYRSMRDAARQEAEALYMRRDTIRSFAGVLTVPTLLGGGLMGQMAAQYADGNEMACAIIGIIAAGVLSYRMTRGMCRDVNARIGDLESRMRECNYHINRLW